MTFRRQRSNSQPTKKWTLCFVCKTLTVQKQAQKNQIHNRPIAKIAPKIHSFVFVLIRLNSLVSTHKIHQKCSFITRLVSLISATTKEYFSGLHLCIRSIKWRCKCEVKWILYLPSDCREALYELISPSISQYNNQGQTTAPGTSCPTLYDTISVWVLLRPLLTISELKQTRRRRKRERHLKM